MLTIGMVGHAGITPAQMAEAAAQMAKDAITSGIAFDARFIHPDFPSEERSSVQELLASKNWAIVAIGSGLRLPAEQTRLLEDVVNMVLSTVHPTPKLAFPTLPTEMIPTFERLLGS